jgi:ABC-type multidrug transport system fused ATPase/permease subunit
LLAFLAYLTQLYDPVRGLNRLWGQAVATSAAAERVIELMDRQPSVVESVDPSPLNRAAGSIDFDGVSYRYPGTNQDALTDVSFTLAPGETLALVGQSGAGKSTATRLLLRLDDPSTGRILIDGHDLRDVSITSLRENVTVLPQEALFFDVTVREAIAYGRPGASNEEIVEAARIAGAHEFIELLPEGYDTRVGQRGRSLSGGQRQRLAIARALLRDAPVLVLDEPTTGLDDENATQILESVRRLMEGKTTIIVSHDLHLVRQATRIVVLERGRVVEEGNHEALIKSDGLYARLSLARQRDGQAGIAGGSGPDGKSGDRRREARGGRWRDAQVASPLGTTRAAS